MTEIPMGSRDDVLAGGGTGGTTSSPVAFPVPADELGSVSITPDGAFEAGSYQTFVLTYIAGKFGIDDSGSMRVCFRFASDQTRPQFEDPKGPNYTTIEASNNAVLTYHYDPKGNVRPWDRTLYIKVVRGFLREGDRITITFGDRSGGSPGMRLQTFCEESYEFHTLIDPIATYCYQPMPVQPVIKIIPGKPDRYLAVAPTIRAVNEVFSIKFKGEDKWGNPSDQCDIMLYPRASHPVAGLPQSVRLEPGSFFGEIAGLSVADAADLHVNFLDEAGAVLCRTNPIRIEAHPVSRHFWGDLHGQSEETIGTGSAEAYFRFARDYAFVDATGHQGNDFQITGDFWTQLDQLCAGFNEDGKFVAIPGYEWSGNTGLGGDRNIYFPTEGRTIRRSSHALVSDHSDIDTDCNSAGELFAAFAEHGEDDVVVYAHCGGRYADIELAHDGRFEKSMEIHSSWGSFEWLVQDAFRLGYRVGIVANSDGHKGRPGASYPGAALFGAVGGLTCFLTDKLSRETILEAIRKRHHYATTGGENGRPLITLAVDFPQGGTKFHDDPRHGRDIGIAANQAIMGDIVHLPTGDISLRVDIRASVAIERVDIFNGLNLIETIRPYAKEDLGSRIRVIWEGAEYRGRFRQVIWDGSAFLSENEIVSASPINFFNKDKTLNQPSPVELNWRALTTGNIGGFDVILADPYSGTFKIETPLIKAGVPLEDIGFEDEVFDNSGVLPRYLKLFRLPTVNPHQTMQFERKIALDGDGDNPVFIRVTLEDGTLCWTSPTYLYR
jgi:hypothetical protein